MAKPATRIFTGRVEDTQHMYPGDARARLGSPLTAPRTTLYAVWLMLLGAALEIVVAVVADATYESLQPQFAAAMHGSGAALVHAVTVAHGHTVVLNSTVTCVVWLVMAYANCRAKSSTPRIISVILFVTGTGYLQQTFSDPNTVPTLVIAVVIWLVGLAATVLLFTRSVQIPFGRRSTLNGSSQTAS